MSAILNQLENFVSRTRNKECIFPRNRYREKIRKQARSQMMQRFAIFEQTIETPSGLIFDDLQQTPIETESSFTHEDHVEPTHEMNAKICNVVIEKDLTQKSIFNEKHLKLVNWAITNNQTRK